MSEDPRIPGGAFAAHMADIYSCKARSTCPDLKVRALYFEPNPCTAVAWEEKGRFLDEIDRRVVFVCESPSAWSGRGESLRPGRCFTATGRDSRFWRIRDQFGFDKCLVTNAVKCGPRRGSRHADQEFSACAQFVVRELALIRPLVVVGVGGEATHALQKFILPLIHESPILHSIHHYSSRGRVAELFAAWETQFGTLVRLLEQLEPKGEPAA